MTDVNVKMTGKVSGLLESVFYCQWWGEPSDNKQVNSVRLENDSCSEENKTERGTGRTAVFLLPSLTTGFSSSPNSNRLTLAVCSGHCSESKADLGLSWTAQRAV